jgi:hypothetical protein
MTLQTSLPVEFHQVLYDYAESLAITRDKNPGNNILPSIPTLQFVFDCPEVRGALTRFVEVIIISSHIS